MTIRNDFLSLIRQGTIIIGYSASLTVMKREFYSLSTTRTMKQLYILWGVMIINHVIRFLGGAQSIRILVYRPLYQLLSWLGFSLLDFTHIFGKRFFFVLIFSNSPICRNLIFRPSQVLKLSRFCRRNGNSHIYIVPKMLLSNDTLALSFYL